MGIAPVAIGHFPPRTQGYEESRGWVEHPEEGTGVGRRIRSGHFIACASEYCDDFCGEGEERGKECRASIHSLAWRMNCCCGRGVFSRSMYHSWHTIGREL